MPRGPCVPVPPLIGTNMVSPSGPGAPLTPWGAQSDKFTLKQVLIYLLSLVGSHRTVVVLQ